jgi:hypothetical protein
MSNSKTKLEELKEQTSVDTTGKQEFLFKYHELENSPFTIIEQDQKFFGVIGDKRVTEQYNNLEEAKNITLDINWDRITQVIWCIVEKTKEMQKLNINENEQ